MDKGGTKTKRLAMVTIGQAPRDDLVPDLLKEIGPGVEVWEFGALDGMTVEQVTDLYPKDDEPRLITRLKDGSEAIVSKPWMNRQLKHLLAELDDRNFDAIVLLCTGFFEGLHPRTLFIESQRVVDHMVAALTETARAIGILVPDAAQAREFHKIGGPGQTVRFGHASPYSDMRFAAAARGLADSDIIVMHCMGYSESMRQTVWENAHRPVLLARRIVSAAVRQIV